MHRLHRLRPGEIFLHHGAAHVQDRCGNRQRIHIPECMERLLWPSLIFTSSDLLTAQIGLDSKVFLMNEPLSNLYFSFGGAQAVARVSKYEISQIGDTIHFVFMPSKMHFFDKETGVNYTEM